jgi:heptose I phosphotransferase
MKLFLRDDFARYWRDKNAFDAADDLQGEVFRRVKGRRTLRFEHDGRGFFIKVHEGVGWAEIAKNLITLKKPVVGAGNEWRAIRALQALSVPTMSIAAYGECGYNPAQRYSFLVTDDLSPAVSLETVCADWQKAPPPYRFKQLLISEVARLCRMMHTHGICHRDLYLCHFLLRCADDGSVDQTGIPHVSVIDLHRALLQPVLLSRWIKKDLAGLYYSALGAGLTRTDLLRFMCAYTHTSARQVLREDGSLWAFIQQKADKILRRERYKKERQLRKRIYKNSDSVDLLRSGGSFALVNKRVWQPELAALIESPDCLIKDAQILKDGDSTTVVALPLAGREWVIKRYNLKGFWYGVSRLFRPSRAWHCWVSAFRLQQAGIDTPEPLLMLEKRWGPFRREAYYVSERVAGSDVKQLLEKESGQSPQWTTMLALFEKLFVSMREHSIVHGDLKATNFLLSQRPDGSAFLQVLDLDACRLELKRERFRKYFSRDLQRFYANWRHHDAAGRVSQLIKDMSRGL